MRLGECFARQQCGRKSGFLRSYIRGSSKKRSRPTSAGFLVELRFRAFVHPGRPILGVDNEARTMTYRDPRRGEIEVTWKTCANLAGLKKVRCDNPECR